MPLLAMVPQIAACAQSGGVDMVSTCDFLLRALIDRER
jgi:hypothetical protein